MSGDSGHVLANTEAIAELETALGRFADQARESSHRADTEVSRIRETLEERRGDLRREIRALSDRIANADEDDDTAAMERRLERATDALERVRRSQQDVDAAADRFKTARLRFEQLNGETSQRARSFLRKTVIDLQAYLALHKDGQGGITAPGTEGGSAPAAPASVTQGFDPTTFSLPPGFRWFAIARINTAQELAGVSDESSFVKGVSYHEMALGYEALRRDILPAIGDLANPAGNDTFAEQDRSAGVPYELGKQRIYEAFFSQSDPIHIEPAGPGELYTVASGRHRIKVAMDLGWTAIPVRSADGANG